MSFQPVVPFGGIAGWAFLNRTRESQQKALDASPALVRDTEHFATRIGAIDSAEALVADRRLLGVALGAFGLEADIDNKFFIRKILEDGTLQPDALANRLSDKRYLAFSKAFGFGDFDVPNTKLSDFPDKIISAYRTQQFEIGIGNQNENLRLAIGLERELSAVLDRKTSENGKWFTIMGTPPLRKVFETALGLPSSTAALDIDVQLRTYKEKAARVFGDETVSQFSDPAAQEKLTRLFLARSEIENTAFGSSPAANALSLLQNAGFRRTV